MFGWKAVCGAFVCALSVGLAAQAQPIETVTSLQPLSAATGASQTIPSGLVAAQASADARYLGDWIAARNDSIGLPFAIVDKKQARIHVFDDQHVMIGSSVVLTGAMPGDESVPGVGQRAQDSRLALFERTTPAGRFPSQPGRNLKGEDIVWFDYQAALAIHRLRPGASFGTRTRRLASETPQDNRASLGCVVVPVAFYERVIRPWLGERAGVVYVLPDSQAVQAWWPSDAPLVARSD